MPTNGSAVAWWLRPRTPDSEVGDRAPLGPDRVVSLNKIQFTPKSTGNTQEAVATSRHDLKIVDRDVKPQRNKTKKCRPVKEYIQQTVGFEHNY